MLERFGDVLKDHFFEMQTKFIPLSEYSACSFFKDSSTFVFFEILLSIVSLSSGSAAAKITASISFSKEDNLDGKLIILFFFSTFFFNHKFSLIYISSKSLSCLILRLPSLTNSKEPANIPALPVFLNPFPILKC